MEIYTLNRYCRLCGNYIQLQKTILSLGRQCISAFVEKEGIEPLEAPLDLVLCPKCNLLQLKHSTNLEVLYTDNYGYRTGLNSTMTQEMVNIKEAVMAQIRLEKGDVVVDIGSNDATLLKMYPNEVVKVGFDPVKKFKEYYNQRGLYHVANFFNFKEYEKLFPRRKAKVITAISMFYDLDDPSAFLKDITEVLDKDGILVLQQNYLVRMLENCAFDNICHEHLVYYSLTTLRELLKKHNLEVFDVSESDINGGSFRIFARFKTGKQTQEKVWKMATYEDSLLLDKLDPYEGFSKKVKENVDKLRDFVDKERAKGKRIWTYAASTRGNTLLQAAGLKYPEIEGCSERNPEKWGKRTLGTNIPIFSEEEARKAKPDYFLVLPYWFKDEFIEREKEYLESGGKLIFPLPEFEVVEK